VGIAITELAIHEQGLRVTDQKQRSKAPGDQYQGKTVTHQ
jgi:hypothetical protein